VALALGAHEQGVFLPLVLAGFIVARAARARRSPWVPVVGAGLVTLGYLALRRAALGPTPGVYQLVTIRPSVVRLQLWLWYAVPPFDVLTDWWQLHWNPWIPVDGLFWQAVARHLGLVGAVLAFVWTWRAAAPFFWWQAVASIPLAMVRWMDHDLLLPDAGSCALAGVLAVRVWRRARSIAVSTASKDAADGDPEPLAGGDSR
jgi:hypothetical protein